jgi:type II secretory pathway component PulF
MSVAVVVISALMTAWIATPTGRRRWHRSLLELPVIGRLRRRVAVARMMHALGALLESGVTIATALTFAARATGDAELEARTIAAGKRIASGEPLSGALSTVDAATPTTIRLLRAGEESARLASMATHAARIEQREADRVVRLLVRLLEPALLLVFASVVAFVAAALLQAIYSVRPAG